MVYNTDEIVVVGGGSAGWMTAATLIRTFPTKKITVVESPTIPTVGVGESTTPQFSLWLKYLNIDYTEFMRETDATIKYAIGFTDFYKKDSPMFLYPFGLQDFEPSMYGYNDWFYKKAILPTTPESSFAEYFFPTANFVPGNKVSFGYKKQLEPFTATTDFAFQIDAAKFGLWLAEKYAKPRGVNHIRGTVHQVEGNEYGVQSLFLEDGTRITADLFIDCSGFKSILLEGFLEEPFTSTLNELPNNKAWAAPYQYTDKEKELEVYTNCTALKNGWVWNTPLWSRVGSGYVYSDQYTDDESALQEFKDHLDSDKMKVVDPNRSKNMEFRKIEIRNGRHKRGWVKNVCAIGLSHGFLEPLESTGLVFVHEYAMRLVSTLQRGQVNQVDIDTYNTVTNELFDFWFGFVTAHFSLSLRDDTPYWHDRSSLGLTNLGATLEILRGSSKQGEPYAISTPAYASLCAGMNFTPTTISDVDSWDIYRKSSKSEELSMLWKVREDKNKLLKKVVEFLPTHYQYLKENIYFETE